MSPWALAGSDTTPAEAVNAASAKTLGTAWLPLNLATMGLYDPVHQSAQSLSDSASALGLDEELSLPLSDRWGLYGGTNTLGRATSSWSDDSNNASWGTRLGLSYAGENWLLRAGVTTAQYALSHEHLRATSGAQIEWRTAAGTASQWSLAGSYSDARSTMAGIGSPNSQTTALSAGWLTALAKGSTVFSLTAAVGLEKGVIGRDDGDRRFYGPRMTIQRTFAERMGAFASAGITYSRYDSTRSTYQLAQGETLYDLALGMTWAVSKGLSIRPQFSAIRNNSHSDLYSYDKNDLTVNVRFDF